MRPYLKSNLRSQEVVGEMGLSLEKHGGEILLPVERVRGCVDRQERDTAFLHYILSGESIFL